MKNEVKATCVSAVACLAVIAGNAHAQASGTTTIGAGWLHIMPQGESGLTNVVSAGGLPVNQDVPDTGTHASNSDAANFSIEYHITDNIGVALLMGTPFTSQLVGDRSLSQFGVIGETRPLAPILEARYHLFSADRKFRPFVGVGVNYTWFANTHLTNNSFIAASFGPGSSASASLSPSWNPVAEIGATYSFARHWLVGASLIYMPLSTTLTTHADTAVGSEIVTKTRIRVNPLITLFNIAYTF
ncbi:OmpW/AlkL family protein [Paraburkholderia guartelaensis]|uniref:OmpW/AlkL family protein n=1 Tax=Paraburkholderia guartelaensis TaxID=2546446 RepID=UPI002AB6A7ED|nr:OmpW family outer membrane protein [Paraburkholderia guartelaensis]